MMRLRLLSGTVALLGIALFLSACNLALVMEGLFGPPPAPVVVTVVVTPLAATPTLVPVIATHIPHFEQGVTSPGSWISVIEGSYWLHAGTTVNLTWHDAPEGLASATFYTTTYQGTRQDIGVDSNPSDGVRVSWTVPYGLDRHQLRADGYGLSDAPFEYANSLPTFLNSEINSEQCYVHFLADQPLYEAPDLSSEMLGTVSADTVYPVNTWSDGWMQINPHSDWLPPDGTISTYSKTCP